MATIEELLLENYKLRNENSRLRMELCRANALHEQVASQLWDLQETVIRLAADVENSETAGAS